MSIEVGTLIGYGNALWRIVKITKKRLYVEKVAGREDVKVPAFGSSIGGWRNHYIMWDASHCWTREVQTFESEAEWLAMIDGLKPLVDAVAEARAKAGDASEALDKAARTYGRIVTVEDSTP